MEELISISQILQRLPANAEHSYTLKHPLHTNESKIHV